ncbi:hypothetical protein WJX81_003161 [Elliptochloris bilobata]|uniref:Protein kinase domain-containing protein n=1 Tax=Elliptochloris bilobata TaxID=381761 RepID=A0AAW1QVU2_9CHLO
MYQPSLRRQHELLTVDVGHLSALDGCLQRFAPPPRHHVDPFGLLDLVQLWPANSSLPVKPRPWPVGPAYNSSEFQVFINTTYVTLNDLNYLSPTFNNSGYPPGPANHFHNAFTIMGRVLYPMSLLWTVTYCYQINQPPPLGHPDCQFPELTQPGLCANQIVYIPTSPDASLDDLIDRMANLKLLPKLINAWDKAGAPAIMPPKYIKREVVKGSLGPVGRFRSPLATRTNSSTLHLYGPRLHALAGWQVEAMKGALWDAYAEVAIYMEILQVQVGAPRPGRPNAKETCRGEEALCAPCGAALTGPLVALTFSYDFFEIISLDSDIERYRPVLTEHFLQDLHSRGIDIDAVHIAPASTLVRLQHASHPLDSSWPQKDATSCLLQSELASDDALRGLLAYEDISLCRRSNGAPWLLGCGAHGKVYRAMRKGVQDAAVKLLTNVDAAQLAVFTEEIRLLRRISFDRNVVQFYGACLETQPPMLVMEYMGGGDLFSALQSSAQGSGAAHPLSWWRRGRIVALDIARGLHFLHSEHVVHNDLKTKNILLSDNYEIAKIADVGLARIMDASHLSTGLAPCGTFAYAAPEVLMGRRCDEKVDIYSFGVVLWELVCQERPMRGHLRAPRVPEECPDSVRALVDACIEAEAPAQRPSAYEVFVCLAHSPATLEEAEAAAAGMEESLAGTAGAMRLCARAVRRPARAACRAPARRTAGSCSCG